MVWAGIWSTGRVGPFFFEDSVNSLTYLQMLNNQFWPAVSNEVLQHQLWFQHDGASAHFARPVRAWLDSHFPNRWLGRGGEVGWPPRSPDLTPPDFYLWGHLKDQVYARNPRNTQELKQFIIEEFNAIPQNFIENSCRSVIQRLEHCYEYGGGPVYVTYH
jgi:hypothetical protein